MKIWTKLTTAALLSVAAAGGAKAATFTDPTSFLAAITPSFTEDFETLSGTNAFAGPITFTSGLTVSSQSNDLFTVAPGQSTNPTQAVGSNTPASDTLFLSLGGIFGAFGADVFQNNGGGAQGNGIADFVLRTFLGNALVETLNFTVAPNGGSFFGMTQTAGLFDTVEVAAISGSLFEVVDNATAGDPIAPIPLPAGGWLLIGGLGALIGLRRLRKA
jgi:hypothetical protein